MMHFISFMIALSLAGFHTSADYLAGDIEKPAAETETAKTDTEVGTEKEAEKETEAGSKDYQNDPLYPYIAQQNKLVEKDGVQYITNPENILVLANKEYSLQSSYSPPDLVRPNVTFSFGDAQVEKAQMRKEAGTQLEAMFAAAKQDNLTLYAVSGYRSYQRQQEVFSAEVDAKGESKAKEAVAVPGTSEHQTGLAMDISSRDQGFNLTEAFGETPEGQWLQKNAHKYGFILRYMKGKEAVTQYQYESWHYRYVGKDAATIIYENDWTLEEFFQHVRALQKKIDGGMAK
ncbi:M15 family metallopeptidase [Listeria cornellensis]|uniref:D-alanyl-D-alanine carboxypeptidase n=1 Tax=Listeria cornellensis FSL F6-0969 TaxID=1265820 RepID=W7BWJ4_9LIST|nr:M15 family metallopeptidase [Listeria cornellensis]EUJ31149.1 D-alanyl-D-alanine carboxypeptidase [Listeria cornellensis FSL F6-0969]